MAAVFGEGDEEKQNVVEDYIETMLENRLSERSVTRKQRRSAKNKKRYSFRA
jgi:hypothetical protein